MNLNHNMKNDNNINMNNIISDNEIKENNLSNSSYRLSKIKNLKDNQKINFLNFQNFHEKILKNDEKKYLNENKKLNPHNGSLSSLEKNRGMIMNNLNNYFIYNNYRGDNQNENLNLRNNINIYSENPIINNIDNFKKKEQVNKDNDFFNLYMNNNNMKLNNLNKRHKKIHNNTQIINNKKKEKIYMNLFKIIIKIIMF